MPSSSLYLYTKFQYRSAHTIDTRFSIVRWTIKVYVIFLRVRSRLFGQEDAIDSKSAKFAGNKILLRYMNFSGEVTCAVSNLKCVFSPGKRSNVYVDLLEIGLKEIYGFWMWSFESLIDGSVDVLMSICENKLVQRSVENVRWNWFCDTSDVEKLLLSTSSST